MTAQAVAPGEIRPAVVIGLCGDTWNHLSLRTLSFGPWLAVRQWLHHQATIHQTRQVAATCLLATASASVSLFRLRNVAVASRSDRVEFSSTTRMHALSILIVDDGDRLPGVYPELGQVAGTVPRRSRTCGGCAETLNFLAERGEYGGRRFRLGAANRATDGAEGPARKECLKFCVDNGISDALPDRTARER
jgi:hypothetical protein